jgi:hypothetical protein
MGWLDCNPDELFLPTRFTVRDLPYYTPGPVENFLIGLSHITPDFVMRSLDGPLSTSFVARPMQVPSRAKCSLGVSRRSGSAPVKGNIPLRTHTCLLMRWKQIRSSLSQGSSGAAHIMTLAAGEDWGSARR